MAYATIGKFDRHTRLTCSYATLVLALMCLAAPTQAAQLRANTAVSIAAPSGGGDDSDSQLSTDPAAVLNLHSEAIGDYKPASTTVTTGIADAKASATELGVGGSILVEDYDPTFDTNCCMNVSAGASFFETFTVTNTTQLDSIFASPIWYVEGSLQGDNVLSATVRVYMQGFSSVTGPIANTLFLLESTADGTVQSAAQNVAPMAFGVGTDGYLEISTRLTLEIEGGYPPDTIFGDTYLASADFMNTATFGGFEVFADEAMTTPVLSGVTISSADGQIDYPVVPIPAAVWLFGSALAGLGWLRRRQTA